MDWRDILTHYHAEFIACAQAVGIDGTRLLQCLPPSGRRLTGKQVPVLEKKYQYNCSVLFHINHTSNGGSWPFFRFHTFKHGGISEDFHGLKLFRQQGGEQVKRTYRPVVNIKQRVPAPGLNNAWRLRQFQQLSQAYFSGVNLTGTQWLQQRLCGWANPLLIERVPVRVSAKGDLIAAMSHPQHGLIGYHHIQTRAMGDQKCHRIAQSGLMKGAAIIIAPLRHSHCESIAICEGLATGLSLGLCFPGTIYVALTANNLQAVRAHLAKGKRIHFFADNDQYKPEVGNVGIRNAQAAAQAHDSVYWPRFNVLSVQKKATDYNDLLMYEGIAALQQQVLQVA